MKYLANKAVSQFECLQADCPDTCCKGWSMQVDDETFAKYEGTELEGAIAYDGVDKEIRVMKRDAETDYCVKFTDGICSIHAEKGAEYLGDACNFYPRVTRKVVDQHIMTATLSCPEIARLMLFEDNAASTIEEESERFPHSLKAYNKADLSAEDMLKVHQIFLDACEDQSASPEQILARIYSATQSLNYIDPKEWPDATTFMLKMADGKLPQSHVDEADAYKVLQIFTGIIHATGKQHRKRLTETIELMEKALGVQIDWETLILNPANQSALADSQKKWNENKTKFDSILRKYIQSQLSFATFPFAGLADNIVDKVKLIIYRFALVRIGLMAVAAKDIDEEEIIKIIQSTSRVMDHLGDATLTLNLFEQCGWNNDARIRGLIGN